MKNILTDWSHMKVSFFRRFEHYESTIKSERERLEKEKRLLAEAYSKKLKEIEARFVSYKKRMEIETSKLKAAAAKTRPKPMNISVFREVGDNEHIEAGSIPATLARACGVEVATARARGLHAHRVDGVDDKAPPVPNMGAGNRGQRG